MESKHKSDHDLTKTTPSQLALLMGLDESQSLWSETDHMAIMRHLMESTIPGHATAHRHTFGQVLTSTHPDVEQLRHVKEFAKSCRTDPHSELPPDLATALYYGSIVAARLHGHRISQLTNAEVREGIEWALARNWLPEPLRHLFHAASIKLSTD